MIAGVVAVVVAGVVSTIVVDQAHARSFSLLDQRLSGREFVADEPSIADLMWRGARPGVLL